MHVKLRDAQVRATNGRPSSASISPTGDRLYAVYHIIAGQPSSMAGELWYNADGRLFSRASIMVGQGYPLVAGGRASPDFSRFSLLQYNLDGQIRLQMHGPNLAEHTERIFSDFLVDSRSVTVSGFSEDGRCLAVAYERAPGKTIVRLVRAALLTDAATVELDGRVHSSLLFRHREKLYLALVVGPEPMLRLFRKEKDRLIAVASAPLPNLGEVAHLEEGHHSLLLVGTRVAPKAVGVYLDVPSAGEEQDGAEFRIYALTDEEKGLKLVGKRALDADVSLTAAGRGRLLLAQSEPGSPEFFCFLEARTERSGKLMLSPLTVPKADARTASTAISADGRWMFRLGAHGSESIDSDWWRTKNVLLYQLRE